MRPLELAGQRFGRLVALERQGAVNHSGAVMWRCICDCGAERSAAANRLKSGVVRSCGCLITDAVRSGENKRRTHGRSGSPTYISWLAMRARCSNPSNNSYRWYGAKGIKVCERWQSFEAFYEDMGPRPPGKSIDRLDGSKDYSPDNCRWATALEQTTNRSNTRREKA